MSGNDTPPGIDLTDMHERLLGARAAILHARDQSADARRPIELDQASVGRLSRMDAIQGQAMALAADQSRTATLARI
jgi:DnaK suppressor protein